MRFGLLMAFNHWMCDFGNGFLISLVDMMAGGPAQANRTQNMCSPLAWIVHTFFAQRYAP